MRCPQNHRTPRLLSQTTSRVTVKRETAGMTVGMQHDRPLPPTPHRSRAGSYQGRPAVSAIGLMAARDPETSTQSTLIRMAHHA